MSLDDYPYEPNEPWKKVYGAHGLDKLRYVRDRELAQSLFDLYQALSHTEKLMDVVKRAHSGMLGADAERMAIQTFGETLGRPSRDRLEDFLRRLPSVKQSTAWAPAQCGDDLRKEVRQ